MEARDKEQLNKMKANERAINKIMTDIYGQQDGYVIQHGLADADDAEDFSAKLFATNMGKLSARFLQLVFQKLCTEI